jgi:Sulfotransferase family
MHRGIEPVRVFVVGFPRSGTTLLQSLLAAHPEVVSPPETLFFMRLVSWRYWHRCLVPPRREVRARLASLAERDTRLAPLPALNAIPSLFAGPLVRNFVSALDETTRADCAHAWVEKTPIHLHRIPLIERHVGNARFVHVLRSGLPAIASLYSVTNEYPEQWGGKRTLEGCVARWQQDVRLSSECVSRSGHAFVSYERLTEDASQTLQRLTSWLKLRSQQSAIASMLASYKAKSSQVIANEPWKADVSSPITNRNSFRVDRLWTRKEQLALRHRLASENQLLEALPYI